MSATVAAPLAPAAPLAIASTDGSRQDVEGPRKLAVTNTTSRSISLEWNAVKAAGFSIERSLDGNKFEAIAKVGSDSTQFTDVGLQPGTHYFYRVRAFVNGNVSQPSPIADATTLSFATPLPVKDPSAGIPTL
jgi:hypothetical protein